MVFIAQKIVQSSWFEHLIIGLIIFTALLIGFEAFPHLQSETIHARIVQLHNIILLAFIIEAAIKITAHWPRPLDYFKSGWNIFDFSLIVLSLLPLDNEFALLGRIFRLLRVLRLVNAMPELRIIVETLVRSIPSMFHISLLMSILFFVYAVLGFHLFHEHDPTHWRNLAHSLLTLFRIVTLEDWTDVMYTAMELSPFYAIFFVSFVVFGTFVVINLFIAVVINNLEQAKYAQLEQLDAMAHETKILLALAETKQNIESVEHQLRIMREQKIL